MRCVGVLLLITIVQWLVGWHWVVSEEVLAGIKVLGGGIKRRLCLYCHDQSDSCIKMDSSESHCNVPLIVMDKVTWQFSQTTAFEEREGSRNRIEPVLLLTSPMLYCKAKLALSHYSILPITVPYSKYLDTQSEVFCHAKWQTVFMCVFVSFFLSFKQEMDKQLIYKKTMKGQLSVVVEMGVRMRLLNFLKIKCLFVHLFLMKSELLEIYKLLYCLVSSWETKHPKPIVCLDL